MAAPTPSWKQEIKEGDAPAANPGENKEGGA